jgi:hypothetical protein
VSTPLHARKTTSEYCVDFGYSIGRHDKTKELADTEPLRAINQHIETFYI